MARCRHGSHVLFLGSTLALASCMLLLRAPHQEDGAAGPAFVDGFLATATSENVRGLRGRVALQAEATERVELVKINTANVQTTAGLLSGLVGFLLGGIFVGAGLFAAGSYIARQEGEFSKGLQGVSEMTLEALNFTAGMDNKYQVTGKLGQAVNETLASTIKPQDRANVESAVRTLSDTVTSIDEELGIRRSVGPITLSASEYAAAAVGELVKFDDKNKVSETVFLKISEVTGQKKLS
mmetsp:Transcript_45098/g.107214  ORF Transcript_45098/g.107214 Transcript_45098/m.107214 type:complete len:239 (-) Transcript_45098:147-863(-)|eukprot:CAMPEP_0178440074 /NCGR_PEP_ID=MMETSP0689_2-20121128/36543_1 /TAXON_ID=160604 /ORGANISM="Amphidinium massartii, Strain CS-259" /LENGTH=238 /DNA_ID=CAMNT_0020062741 /DNA_START=60 /DNA_END=776 /DNA_ORIENTATION=-